MKVKGMIDLVLVKEDLLEYVYDVKRVKGLGKDISDHSMILCKVKLLEI